MPTFTMRDDIHCNEERFWQLFFDKDLQRSIFTALGFPKWEIVEQTETEKEIVRIVKAIPKLDAPGAVTKVLGPGFGYVEDSKFDKATKTYRFKIKPSVLAEKIVTEGKVTCEPKGDDRCTRVVEITLEAKIFGVGGMLEKVTEKSMRDGWGKGAEMFNAHLKK